MSVSPYSGLVLLVLLVSIHSFVHSVSLVEPVSRSSRCPVHFGPHPPFPIERDLHGISTSRNADNNLSWGSRLSDSNLADYPLINYLAVIASRDTSNVYSYPLCSAAVVSSRMLLTSGWCVGRWGIKDTIAYVGGKFGLGGTPIEVEEFIVHPDSLTVEDKGYLHDIAFVKLKEAVPGSYFMKISINSKLPEDESYVRVAGYGFTSYDMDNARNSTNVQLRARQFDIPVYKEGDCRAAWPSRTNYSLYFCAGYEGTPRCLICPGDNGAPLFQYDGDTPLIVGIAIGWSCGYRDRNFHFLRTGTYKSFFQQVGLRDGIELVTMPKEESSSSPSAPTETPSVEDGEPEDPNTGGGLQGTELIIVIAVPIVFGVIIIIIIAFCMWKRSGRKLIETARGLECATNGI